MLYSAQPHSVQVMSLLDTLKYDDSNFERSISGIILFTLRKTIKEKEGSKSVCV